MFTTINAEGQRQTLKQGMVITKSALIEKRTYRLPHSDETGKTAAVVIRGNDLVVDFGGAMLEGSPQTIEPNERKGTAIRVEGRNVVVKNVRVRGYKIGLIAYDSPGIKVLNSDFSYNWKQRLASTLEREDLSDWMSFHRNENDQWLRFGAGIYLRRCDNFEVKAAVVRGGQCGLMLTECNKGLVWNSDFSFLSAIGLGIYRSSDNRIMHNRIDWCVRGYSHGVYNRGQDSAGILIYEQSHRNTFAYNSVTHGGDGFFLWAGQTTMDTGQGGCNDNLLYGNDFSHAPTNGIEATFSRNAFANNLLMENWHGIWGGYSYDSKVIGNLFAYNAESIAIEHGQKNVIQGNLFFRENTALNLWQNEKQDPNWGYPKYRETRSYGYDIRDNLFTQITRGRTGNPNSPDLGTALRLKATSDVTLQNNRFGQVGTLYDLRGPFTNFRMGNASQTNTQAIEPFNLDSLGTGWDAAKEGRVTKAGVSNAALPPILHPSGNVILPYPDGIEGYPKRFVTNWNPLLPKSGGEISIGNLEQGRKLFTVPETALKLAPQPLAGGINPFIKPNTLRGRGYILVDNWGPYDFKSPLLWLRRGMDSTPDKKGGDHFELFGPKGKWRAKKVVGGELSSTSGTVPGFVRFQRAGNSVQNVKIELEYIGNKTIDFRGIETPASTPIAFGYSEYKVLIDWKAKFFRYDKNTQEPRTMFEAFQNLVKGKPLAELQTNSLDLIPGRIPREVPNDYFATIADGTFELEPGDYIIELTTDDGGRLYLDDKLLVDEWHYQGPTLYSRNVKLNGKHRLRVEHFQIDGYWTLKVNIRPK